MKKADDEVEELAGLKDADDGESLVKGADLHSSSTEETYRRDKSDLSTTVDKTAQY